MRFRTASLLAAVVLATRAALCVPLAALAWSPSPLASVVTPVISSIEPDTASAGTGELITIRGHGFGAFGGAAKVSFLYKPPDVLIDANWIVSWSDSEIVCNVPVDNKGYRRSAASGPVSVADASGAKSKGYDFKVTFGYLRRWQTPVYRYVIDTANKDWRKMIRAAADTWNDTGQFTFVYENGKAKNPRWGNRVNEVYWGPLNGDTLAHTVPKFAADGETLIEEDIVFNSNKDWGRAMLLKYDVQTIALHELGHVVGLRDLYGDGDVKKAMYGNRSPMGPDDMFSKWSWGRHRQLAAGDIAGATWIRKQYSSTPGVAEPFPISRAGGSQQSPAVSGSTVVWADTRNGGYDIYGCDLSSMREFAVATGEDWQYTPAISGSKVIWVQEHDGDASIYGRDLISGERLSVCTAAGRQVMPEISGNTVVWSDNRNGAWDIYGYDLVAKREFLIAEDVCSGEARTVGADVAGDTVVWADESGNVAGYDLTARKQFAIFTKAGEWPQAAEAVVSDSAFVWVEFDRGAFTLHGRWRNGGGDFTATSGGAEGGPALSGDLLVWSEGNGDPDIYGRRLSSGAEFPVYVNPTGSSSGAPDVSGNTVVWQHIGSRAEVYCVRLQP